MRTFFSEYEVKCPYCNSEIRVVTEESNPFIFYCHGCNRNVVVHNNMVYTVSSEFIRKLTKLYKSKICGKIVSTIVSENAKSKISKDRIIELHNLLQTPMDVSDFIEKIQ